MQNDIGKILIIVGVIVVAIGLMLNFLPKGTGLPKLPGDVYIKRDNFTFYFPVVTSILVSIILSILFYLFYRK